MSPGRPRRLWGEGLRLVPLSRLDGRRMRPWNLARLGLRLRCRFILPGLGLRDLGASRTRVLSSSSSELLPELSVGLLPSSDLGMEICSLASGLLAVARRSSTPCSAKHTHTHPSSLLTWKGSVTPAMLLEVLL